MEEEPVIAAFLETDDRLRLLEKTRLRPSTAEELDYGEITGESLSYREYAEIALQSSREPEIPDYHTLTDKLVEEPSLLYDQGLLKEEIERETERHLQLLRDNMERPLNPSERDAVTSTAMDQELFTRNAVDKESLVNSIKVDIYPSPDKLPERTTAEYGETTA